MLDSSDTVTVSGGQFTVNIEGGMPKIYHPATGGDLIEEREEGEDEGQLNTIANSAFPLHLLSMHICIYFAIQWKLQIKSFETVIFPDIEYQSAHYGKQ